RSCRGWRTARSSRTRRSKRQGASTAAKARLGDGAARRSDRGPNSAPPPAFSELSSSIDNLCMVKDMSRRRFIGLLALALGVVGCGDGIKRVPVKGKLTAKGTPIEGGYVQFIPGAGVKGEGGIGLSDRDGNFSVKGL